MSRHLTGARAEFAEAVREFTRRETGAPERRRELTHDGTERHNQPIYNKLGQLGWIGVALPTEYGGSGGDLLDECIMLQELARGGAPIGGIIPSLIVAGTYEKFGTEQQRQQRIRAIADGEVHAIAMSEPQAGSDVAALTCKAERRGDEFVINGQKTWITNAHFADWILLVARTDATGQKHHGLTMFGMPLNTEGIEVRTIRTMGEAEVNEVFLTDCVVPANAVIGNIDRGWAQLMSGLERERLMMASQLLGVAQRVLARVQNYVLVRDQFGKRLSEFQVVRHQLADMAIETECCEAFVYTIVEEAARGTGRSLASETSMVKLKASEVLKSNALKGIQLMGAYGYTVESEMEQDVKTGIAATIYGGTNEIQKEIIAKHMGLGR